MRALLFLVLFASPAFAADLRGRLFVPLGAVTTDANGTYVTGRLKSALDWDELVVSWNLRQPSVGLSVEAQVIYRGRETKWYHLGKWCADPAIHPRESVKDQRDEDGTVDTDTLKLKQPGGALRLRITTTAPNTKIDFIGLSFAESRAGLEPLPPNTNAWGKTIAVEERSQADYPEGINEWCSPTASSMLLNFWSRQLNRPDLDHSVPETARAVNDPNWPGTGNWPFNTAFAGSHRGIRAYVARLSDVSELEDWIAAGIPIVFSVSYGLLKGDAERGNGHLLVCVGFTDTGDIIVNDPGRRQVRQTYTRANLIEAWAESENTVYLIYPESANLPSDRFSHWVSRETKISAE